MDEIALVLIMCVILMSIGIQQQKASDRLKVVEAKPDTVYVIAVPGKSFATVPDSLFIAEPDSLRVIEGDE